MSTRRLNPFQLLELNVISAQDLAKVARNMKTYAVAWVHPDRKLSTRVDTTGHTNPTWNDKFVFRVDDTFLNGDTSAVMIEIYAVGWLRDVHVGTVRVIVGNLVPAPNPKTQHIGMRFVALQIRRKSSGRPQGILNIGVAILDSSMRSMPLYTQLSASAVGYRQMMDDSDRRANRRAPSSHNSYLVPWIPKPELRRTKSDSSSLVVPIEAAAQKKSKMVKARSELSGTTVSARRKRITKISSAVNLNGSLLFGSLTKGKYGSEIDLGPSISEVAAMNRRYGYQEEEGSEVLGEWSLEDSMEGLQTKLERWRGARYGEREREREGEKEMEMSSVVTTGRKDRSSGGFSCFSNICGLQCSIVCCGGTSSKHPRPRRSPSTYSMTSYF